MIFNSLDFAIFLPIVFILYWFVFNKSLKLQNLLIVAASYLFYGWWDWRFLSLIIFSTIIDYSIGRKLKVEENTKNRKLLLWISILVNLGLLGFFKYYNFFLENFVAAFSFFGSEIKVNSLNIILPVGISFYTFQTLSYTIDVYRKKLEPTDNFIVFAAFVSFFPQLVAGPIERATNLLPQFTKERKLKFLNIQFGLIRILWGLFKKVVVADRLSLTVNSVYNSPDDFGGIHYIIATILFAFQIYCDFSGYSDIAIGTARMFNFKLMENFRSPYFSKSLGEFWRRWHISLSTWFRDYIYIPLGGNRVKKHRFYLNTFLVFVISGFWHGSKWTFIIWGAIHGIILVLENILYSKKTITNKNKSVVYSIIKTLVTFTIVCIAWIFFRANSTSDAFLIVSNLFDFSQPLLSVTRGMHLYLNNPLWKFIGNFILIAVLLFIEYLIINKKISEVIIIKKKPLFRWCIYTSLILIIMIFGFYEIDQFIYFQF
ncbi:MBOAT family O-acyltransferase [Polaribacter sargassicola]|uniref:MBOAT family O-acyltransferase n=1 Tax=Polaribacter sargassicola TaxID=2836891 RepID=UPI001F3F5C14|nr:MBOAT family O-acyltransferase [Polaribacter sp. DS7-9]MCG1037811.1 MBOAT family protein [Polaribacter sp. DS7-9]